MDAVKQLAYSSMAAFLAHHRVLRDAAAGLAGTYPLSAQDHKILDEMQQLMETLTPEERAILIADAASTEGKCVSAEKRRQHARAELKLRRLLQVKGILCL